MGAYAIIRILLSFYIFLNAPFVYHWLGSYRVETDARAAETLYLLLNEISREHRVFLDQYCLITGKE